MQRFFCFVLFVFYSELRIYYRLDIFNIRIYSKSSVVLAKVVLCLCTKFGYTQFRYVQLSDIFKHPFVSNKPRLPNLEKGVSEEFGVTAGTISHLLNTTET